MAKNNNLTDFLTDIATTIRNTDGSTSSIDPQDFSERIVNYQNKTVTPSDSEQTITKDSGYMALGTVTVKAGSAGPKATVKSGTSYDSVSKTITYDSTNTRYSVALSGTVSAPTVSTAGYISNTQGTRNTSTATGSTTLPRIALGTAISGTVAATPVVGNITSSVSGKTQIEVVPTTSTTGIDTYYMAVGTAAKKNTITATPSVSTEGYGDTSHYGATSATASAGANASGTYYIPVPTAGITVSGGDLSKGTASGGGLSGGDLSGGGLSGAGDVAIDIYEVASGSQDANVTLANVDVGSKDTTNYPYYFKVGAKGTSKTITRAQVDRAKVTRAAFSQSVTRAAVNDTRTAGWVPTRASTTIVNSDSTTVSLAEGELAAGSLASTTTTVTANESVEYVKLKKGAITASGSVTVSGSGSVNPGSITVANQTAAVTDKIQVTASPTTGTSTIDTYYMAVKATAAANNSQSVSVSGSGTATASVSSEGYVKNETGSGSVSATGSATVNVATKDSAVTYIPLASATVTTTGGGLTKGTASGGTLSGGGLTAGTGEVSITQNPEITPTIARTYTISGTGDSSYGVTTTQPSSGDYATFDPGATVNKEAKAKGRGSVTRAAVTRAAFSQQVNRASVTDTRTDGWLGGRSSTIVIGGDSTTVTLASDSTTIPQASGTSNYSSESSTTTTVNDGTNYYIPILSPAFKGGDLNGSDISGSQTKGKVTIAEDGTFFTKTGYGVTTTKPSGTDGTNYLTVHETHSTTTESATGSTSVTRAPVLYNGAVHGLVNKADEAQALSGTSKTVSASISVTPSVTDNFEPYYIPIVSPAFDGGGLTGGGAISPSVTAPTVEYHETGTFVDSTKMTTYGITTSKPSGTDGTDYLTVDATHTESNGSVSGSKTVKRNAVLYNGAVHGAVNKADDATALAADTTGTAVSVSATVDPAVTDNFEPYYVPIKTASATGGTASASASQTGMTAGVSSTETSYYFTSSASATGGSASVGKGITAGASASGTSASDSSKVYLKGATATGNPGTITYVSHTQDSTNKKKFTVTGSVSAPAPTTTAGYMSAGSGSAGSATNRTVSLTITDAQAQAAVGAGTATVQDRTSGGSAVGYGKEVSLTAGYYSAQKFYNSIGAGTIDVNDLTITPNVLSGSWDSTNNKYVVSQASKTATMQSSVTTAGYVSDTVGTKNIGTATVSAPSNLNIPKATFTTSGNTVSVATAGYIYSGTVGTVATGTITNDTTLPSGSTSSGNLSYNKYIKIGAGYYASDVYYKNGVSAGSATTPTASGASTSTSLSGTTLTVARSVTPTVVAGYVSSGTAGTVTITGTVPTETKSASGAGDITPSSGKLLSKVTVASAPGALYNSSSDVGTTTNCFTANGYRGSSGWTDSGTYGAYLKDMSVAGTAGSINMNYGTISSIYYEGTINSIGRDGADAVVTINSVGAGNTHSWLYIKDNTKGTVGVNYDEDEMDYKTTINGNNVTIVKPGFSGSNRVTDSNGFLLTAAGTNASATGTNTVSFDSGCTWSTSNTASGITATGSATGVSTQYTVSTAGYMPTGTYGGTNGTLSSNTYYLTSLTLGSGKTLGYLENGGTITQFSGGNGAITDFFTTTNITNVGKADYYASGTINITNLGTSNNSKGTVNILTPNAYSTVRYGGSTDIDATITLTSLRSATIPPNKSLSVDSSGNVSYYNNGTLMVTDNWGSVYVDDNASITELLYDSDEDIYKVKVNESTVYLSPDATSPQSVQVTYPDGYLMTASGSNASATGTATYLSTGNLTLSTSDTSSGLYFTPYATNLPTNYTVSTAGWIAAGTYGGSGNIIAGTSQYITGLTIASGNTLSSIVNNGGTITSFTNGGRNSTTTTLTNTGTITNFNLGAAGIMQGTITNMYGKGTVTTLGSSSTTGYLIIDNNGYSSTYKGTVYVNNNTYGEVYVATNSDTVNVSTNSSSVNVTTNTNGTVRIGGTSNSAASIYFEGLSGTVPASKTIQLTNNGNIGSSSQYSVNAGYMYLTGKATSGYIYYKNQDAVDSYCLTKSSKLNFYYTTSVPYAYQGLTSSVTRYPRTLTETLAVGSNTYYVVGYWSGGSFVRLYDGGGCAFRTYPVPLGETYIRYYTTSSSTSATAAANTLYLYYDSVNVRLYLLCSSNSLTIGIGTTIGIPISIPIILGQSSTTTPYWTAGASTAGTSATIYRTSYTTCSYNSSSVHRKFFLAASTADRFYLVNYITLSATASSITGTLNTSVLSSYTA